MLAPLPLLQSSTGCTCRPLTFSSCNYSPGTQSCRWYTAGRIKQSKGQKALFLWAEYILLFFIDSIASSNSMSGYTIVSHLTKLTKLNYILLYSSMICWASTVCLTIFSGYVTLSSIYIMRRFRIFTHCFFRLQWFTLWLCWNSHVTGTIFTWFTMP